MIPVDWFSLVFAGSLKESQAQISFTEEPQDTTAIAGKPISLNCTAKAPRKVRYVWYFSNSKVVPDNTRLFIRDDGTLHITNVERVDAGQYQCTASYRNRNTAKKETIRSQAVDLTVHSK